MNFGREFIVLLRRPSMLGKLLVHTVEVWTKNILDLFIESQTHFGLLGGAKNEFGPQRTKIDCSLFKFKHLLHACTTSGMKLLVCVHHRIHQIQPNA
jgi:hypothetical protein